MPSVKELLGIELPVIQAPMAGVQGSALAIAVSNAGGLGSLPCALLSIDAMRAELAAIAAGTTKPYNVNFFECGPSRGAEEPRRASYGDHERVHRSSRPRHRQPHHSRHRCDLWRGSRVSTRVRCGPSAASSRGGARVR